jgi:spermidine synthase
MPESLEPTRHVRPLVYDDRSTKSLYFAMTDLQNRMRLLQPDLLDVDYTRTMMGFLPFNSRPDAIAMIGLGGGSLAKLCYRYLPHTQIAVVEINPHVIALRDEFRVPKNDQRFRVIQADGAHFVRNTRARFDVLLVDGFGGQGQSA